MSTIDPADRTAQALQAASMISAKDRATTRKRQRRAERKRLIGSVPLHLTLTAIGFTLFAPFLWMVLTSLKPLDQIGDDNWLPALSASTDGGQFSYQEVELIRDTIRAGETQTTRFLQSFVDLEAEDLRPGQIADQINAAIQRAEPIPASAYEGVELSPETQERLAAVEADVANPLSADLSGTELDEALRERAFTVAIFNASVLHDALPGLIPEPVTARFHNYFEVFRQIPFARYYMNSLFIACWVTFLQVFTSSLAAFSFARLQWPGRDKVFLLYLSTMMLPGLVMMIPNYQIMITLGLVDTIAGLILPAAFTAFGTFLLRQFMLSIPASLDEAAEIDGASKWRTYWDVILPLARPGLVTLAIFTFMGNYNSFFWPLVMLKSEHNYTLPIGLLYFDSTAGQETNLLMAAVTMSVVPMIVVFMVMQKQLVKGIQLGAVKG
ncbi:MAG: carbohydrate ABC transporter permease [Planctomycetota bacterium]